MIKWEIRVLLLQYLKEGLSISSIARKLGQNRRTINRWISAGQLEREIETGQVPPPVRRARPTKLEAFKPIIDARLEENLSQRSREYPSTTTRAYRFPQGNVNSAKSTWA